MYDGGHCFVSRLFTSDKNSGMTTLQKPYFQHSLSTSQTLRFCLCDREILWVWAKWLSEWCIGWLWFMLCVPNELFCFWLFVFDLPTCTKIFIMSILLRLILPHSRFFFYLRCELFNCWLLSLLSFLFCTERKKMLLFFNACISSIASAEIKRNLLPWTVLSQTQ